MKAREINDTIRYTMWSVFRQDQSLVEAPEAVAGAALADVAAATEGGDLQIRGWYDVAGLRADADLMVWWHAPTSETLQDAYEKYLDQVLATEPDQREDPTPTLTAIGMALGEHLRRNSDADWRIVTDDQGRDLALASPDESSILFPVDPVAGHWAVQQREWVSGFVVAALIAVWVGMMLAARRRLGRSQEQQVQIGMGRQHAPAVAPDRDQGQPLGLDRRGRPQRLGRHPPQAGQHLVGGGGVKARHVAALHAAVQLALGPRAGGVIGLAQNDRDRRARVFRAGGLVKAVIQTGRGVHVSRL